jgi:hypothetical protein
MTGDSATDGADDADADAGAESGSDADFARIYCGTPCRAVFWRR